EDGGPRKAGLRPFEREEFEEHAVVVHGLAPLGVVVGDVPGACEAPGTARVLLHRRGLQAWPPRARATSAMAPSTLERATPGPSTGTALPLSRRSRSSSSEIAKERLSARSLKTHVPCTGLIQFSRQRRFEPSSSVNSNQVPRARPSAARLPLFTCSVAV